MLKFSIYFLILCLSYSQKSSFIANDFVKKVRESYHRFNNNNSNIVKSSVLSQSFMNFIQAKTNDFNGSVLNINWSDPNNIKLKASEYNLEVSDFIEQRNQLISLCQNLLTIWSDLVVNNPIPDSASNFNFTKENDKVYFSFVQRIDNNYSRIVKVFGLNGMLLELRVQLPKEEEVIIKPKYHGVNYKWLCTGWFYQRINSEQVVEEGMDVKIIYKEVEKNLYPYDVFINVETKSNTRSKVLERLFFRDFKYNDALID